GWLDVLAGVDQAPNGSDGLCKHSLLSVVQGQLDDFLHALSPDDRRNADISIFLPVLAIEVGGAWQHALLVFEVAVGHRDRRGCGCVERGARSEQRYDFAAAAARPL